MFCSAELKIFIYAARRARDRVDVLGVKIRSCLWPMDVASILWADGCYKHLAGRWMLQESCGPVGVTIVLRAEGCYNRLAGRWMLQSSCGQTNVTGSRNVRVALTIKTIHKTNFISNITLILRGDVSGKHDLGGKYDLGDTRGLGLW